MGSYDGAETCDLVGIFLLSKLKKFKINFGLYRDDGLGVSSMTCRLIEKIRNKISEVFNEYNLKITLEVKHKVVDFLDVTFDLNSELYKPFMKENHNLLYVHTKKTIPPV